jgi:predicted  nucleic acid-binding Zn-ribbon protein
MNLSLLYELQDLHREMSIIEKKLKELRESTNLRKLKDEYQRLKEEYQKGEEKLRRNSCQQEIKNIEIKNLEYNKKASEEIKFSRETDTVKKLENIEKQLENLDEKKKTAENNIILLINEADNINSELAETKKRLIFIKKKYLSNKESTDKAIKELEVQKSELTPSIDSLIRKIDTESYEIYCRILKAHPDPVARVENHICSGCKMGVSDMDYAALKSGNRELRCQSCGRLLYYCNP